MISRVALLVCVIMLALAACPAMAAFTGLLVIPTADTEAPGYMAVEYENDGSVPKLSSETRLLNTEVGIIPRVEAGVDFDLGENVSDRVLWDAKYVFSVDKRREIKMAAGTFSSFPTLSITDYIVASKDFHSFRLHFGGQHLNGQNEWFVGADSTIKERLVLMADYTSGSTNYSSAGFTYILGDRIGMQMGMLFPNSDGDTLYTFVLTYTLPYTSHKE